MVKRIFNMKELEKIILLLKDIKPELEKKYKIKEIGIFGSYRRGEQTGKSDVDILVSFERGMTLLKFCALENWLSDILEEKVDLVMKDSLKPNIGEAILQEVLYL